MFITSINKKSVSLQVLISLVIIGIVAGVSFLFVNIIGYRSVALILMLVLSLLAIFLDILPLLLASTVSALIWDYFFIPPQFTLHIENTEDVLMLFMYFFIALINAVLTNRIRKVEKEANEKREKEKTIKLYNTLLNSLSHELRTPIATIVGASDALLDNQTLENKDKVELITEISHASLRLNQQVENLLNISRLESGFIQLKNDWCDMQELVYKVVNNLKKQNPTQQFHINIIEALPLFKIDFGIMEIILNNLLINAINYTPEKSNIYINISRFDFDEMDIAASSLNKIQLVIKISDDGNGFPEAELEKVFDKFYRLNKTIAGGTGLGLSIVKGYVEAQNGTISLKNSPLGGAEFTIHIPAETNYMNALKNE